MTDADNKFTPAWWLRGPHGQTLWSQFFRPSRRLVFREEALATPDGDSLHLYHQESDTGAPRLVLLHGLEGSVRSHYVEGFAALAVARAWNFTLMTFRGCGAALNRAPRLYHSGETGDLGFVLKTLLARSEERLLLAGVSLGGNVLLKYLGETGDRVSPRLIAAGAISVPFDLEAGARHLQKGFARVYDRHFVRRLRAKARRKLAQFPELFDGRALAQVESIEAFDEAVTAPVHGFSGSHDYYTRSSSLQFLPGIRIPTLLVSARDDPFLPEAVLDQVAAAAAGNRYLSTAFADRGGHVGFVSGPHPLRVRYWAETRLMSFFVSHVSP